MDYKRQIIRQRRGILQSIVATPINGQVQVSRRKDFKEFCSKAAKAEIMLPMPCAVRRSVASRNQTESASLKRLMWSLCHATECRGGGGLTGNEIWAGANHPSHPIFTT